MNILINSELSVYDDLKRICPKDVTIKKKIVMKIEKISLEVDCHKDFIENTDNIIFQSKNAVKYSREIHGYISKNKKANVYCMGKYTKREIGKYFTNDVFHPPKDYSSENLMRLLKDSKRNKQNYLIIKGLDGRNYVEKKIEDIALSSIVMNVYKRVPNTECISDKDLDSTKNNYFIVSSRTALKELIKNITMHNSMILVIPNMRIVEEFAIEAFKDVIVIPNDSEAEQYIKIIGEHNEQV